MDKRSTPHPHQNSTADSGFCSSTTAIHSSSLDLTPITTFQSTPYDPKNGASRKRKISHLITTPTTHLASIASSTLNESTIAQSFEKCNISSFTPNYYVQRPEYAEPESPRKKQRSEPSTPAKRETEEQEETEFFRLHNNSFQKTPTKYVYQRLGSPECNKILYGGELKTNSITKNNSLRYDVKRHSPAKKRLFKINEFEVRRRTVTINPHRKYDPVKYFIGERNIECVFERIFPCLSDEDLYSFVRVSKDWRKLVLRDVTACARLGRFVEEARRNKENSLERSFEGRKSALLSPPVCQQNENQSPYFMLNNNLREGQRHSICPKCTKISIVERNIGQCIQQNCGYVYCLNCSSCSSTGPENFHDRCNQSKLLIPAEPNKLRLTLSPKREPLSFLMNASLPKSSSSSFSDLSDFDNSPLVKNRDRRRSSILGDCNRDMSGEEKVYAPRTLPVVKVVSVERKMIEIMEPSSPPKIKNVACSTKSKKYLKRLIRN